MEKAPIYARHRVQIRLEINARGSDERTSGMILVNREEEYPPIQFDAFHARDGGQRVVNATQGSIRLEGSRNPWAR